MKLFYSVTIVAVIIVLAVVITSGGSYIPQAHATTSCGNGNNILVDATGSVLPGTKGTVSAWTNVAGCSSVIVSAKNKAASPSNETFSFQEVVCALTGCTTYSLGSVTVNPGQTKFLNLSIIKGNTEALNSYVTAASSTSTTTDNFHVIVGNVQFPGL